MNRYTVVVLFVLLTMLAVFDRTSALRAIAGERSIRVAVVYSSDTSADAKRIRAAYTETLLENGIPFDWVSSNDLALFSGEQLASSYTSIVFPDGMNRRVSEDAVSELTAFASLGGAVAIIGDAGSRTLAGTYRPGSLFTEISGVNSLLYTTLRSHAFVSGTMHFTNPASVARWSVPEGKTARGDLSGYGYGPLDYPFARASIVDGKVRIDADNDKTPMLTVKDVQRGRVAYIAMPLGYLRTHSDAFPMTMLVSYLTRSNEMPHLVAAPDGIGRLVIDIHIDSSNEFLGIPNFRRKHLLRRSVPMEFDVTAGPDLGRTGDGLGFDACGKGKPFLQSLMPFGRIGSHGGWAHNKFAADIESGKDGEPQMRALVDRNDKCLESVTHVPVLSFAAPVGVHPQPVMTRALDSLGILGYYYTGDTGAPVERPFYDGDLVSAKSWAFPVMPLGSVASVYEMRIAHVTPAGVERWMTETAEYAAAQHGIYLFYSHSYDFLYPGYSDAFGRFLDHVETMERAGKLRTTNMVDMATFMNRFVMTTTSFTRAADGVHVHLANPHGLQSIAFALPKTWIKGAQTPSGVRKTGEQLGYSIYSVTANGTALDVTFTGGSPT